MCKMDTMRPKEPKTDMVALPVRITFCSIFSFTSSLVIFNNLLPFELSVLELSFNVGIL